MDRQEFLRHVKTSLRAAYQDRLSGILLFGSEARGQATEDSDIDLFVLLKGPVNLGKDLRTIIAVLYPLQLEILRPIHAMPIEQQVFEAQEFALYRHAKTEGVWL